jgi:hypothetical protein
VSDLTVFDKINVATKKRKEERANKRDKRKYEKGIAEERNIRGREMRGAAKEFAGLLKDKRYPHLNKFQEGLIKDLRSTLRNVGTTESDPDKLALVAARISAQLEIIELLRDNPKRVIDIVRRGNE